MHLDPTETADKLAVMRALEVPSDAPQLIKEHLKDLCCHIASSLVTYARGKHTTMKPYGMKISRSTRAFKEMPSPLLALTYAVMYQACRTEPGRLKTWQKSPRQNITAPWSRGTISRFVKLQTAFKNNREYLFRVYDKYGGEYMGEETASRRKRKRDFEAEDDNEDF